MIFMAVVDSQDQPPWLPKVAGELRTRYKTSAEAFSRPRGGDLDMRHRLPDPSAWRRRFLGQRLTARYKGSHAPIRISPNDATKPSSRDSGKNFVIFSRTSVPSVPKLGGAADRFCRLGAAGPWSRHQRTRPRSHGEPGAPAGKTRKPWFTLGRLLHAPTVLSAPAGNFPADARNQQNGVRTRRAFSGIQASHGPASALKSYSVWPPPA